jgi:NAD(P)-dependent dehydrogenase (short-subunit alcohol dehydrogenase family)
VQHVLITGASDGIGLALARHYLAAGARVFAVGRRPPDQLAGGRIFPALMEEVMARTILEKLEQPIVDHFNHREGA